MVSLSLLKRCLCQILSSLLPADLQFAVPFVAQIFIKIYKNKVWSVISAKIYSTYKQTKKTKKALCISIKALSRRR